MPPSVPWSNTASTAPRASQRTQMRDSHWVSSTISATVSKPTNAATRRCPCSNSTPPTIGGNTCPKDNGQSGTAKPEPVLVTNAPTKIKTSVAPAVSTAKRCTHTGHTESRNDARMPHCLRWGGMASLLGGLGDRFPQHDRDLPSKAPPLAAGIFTLTAPLLFFLVVALASSPLFSRCSEPRYAFLRC